MENRMPKIVECRDCGEPIMFVVNSQGKNTPVDPLKFEVMVKRKDEERYYYVPEAYVCHFSSCTAERDDRGNR